MFNWDPNTVSRLHDELIEEAEKSHLAWEAQDEYRKHHPRYNPALAWVGRRIVNVGATLVKLSGDNTTREDYKPNVHLN